MLILRICSVLVSVLLIAAVSLHAQPNTRDPQAVAEVAAGRRDTANAAWWGCQTEDSTAAVQAAIDSKARKVIVPYMGAPWILTPVKLRGNLELVLDPGVILLAKKGEFRGGGDSLLTADGVDNLVIRGYGAILRMHKADYQRPPYAKAEWRMGLALRGVKGVHVEGLRAESSGGDGFYISGNSTRQWSENVVVRDCVAYDNHRQGMSVISAVNLLVENCQFLSTGGTAPESGIDLEPDSEHERMQNIVIRNSLFENNAGSGMLVYLRPLTRRSAPVSIRFENCVARMTGQPRQGHAGIAIGSAKEDGPQGLIEFINCTTEFNSRESVRIFDKSASGVKVRFVNCHWNSPWRDTALDWAGPRVPVLLQTRRAAEAGVIGGVEFVNCYVYDTVNRPTVQFECEGCPKGVADLKGTIYTTGQGNPRVRLGGLVDRIDLRILSRDPLPPSPAKATGQ